MNHAKTFRKLNINCLNNYRKFLRDRFTETVKNGEFWLKNG